MKSKQPSSFRPQPSSFPLIPYGKQSIDADDIAAVVSVLQSDWLTCGPKVEEFERAFAAKVGAKHAVAVNSGTAALHAAMFAIGVGPGDEVVVPAITFAASANCAVFQGATPVFADVEAGSLLVDTAKIGEKLTGRTKAIIAVDYAGQPCDYDALRGIAKKHKLALVADACHALGATYKGRPAGSLADLNCFSFHPVKHITTGEGGMVTTNSAKFAQRLRDFRTHGITRDAARFIQVSGLKPQALVHYYEMQSLGYNYRMPDINAALGLSQLKKLDRFVARRREIAAKYDEAFRSLGPLLRPLSSKTQVSAFPPSQGFGVASKSQVSEHAYHLYVVRIHFPDVGESRAQVVRSLKELGIGTQVHYIPVHLHPFYRERFGYGPGLCPVAEAAYEEILSLPMHAGMVDADVRRVVAAIRKVIRP